MKTMSDEKTNFKDIILKDAIITGIISSVIFTFLLQPIMSTGWAILKDTGSQIYTDFNNRIYAGAALGYRYDVERMFAALFVGLLITITFSWALFIYFDMKGSNPIRELKNNDKFKNFAKSRIGFWISISWKLFALAFFILFSIRQYLDTELIYASSELNASFQQKMNALKPYLSEPEENELLSSWAMMKSEADYIQINESLELAASKNGLILPRTLWPDVLNSVFAWP
jgi:hypothetical protein